MQNYTVSSKFQDNDIHPVVAQWAGAVEYADCTSAEG